MFIGSREQSDMRDFSEEASADNDDVDDTICLVFHVALQYQSPWRATLQRMEVASWQGDTIDLEATGCFLTEWDAYAEFNLGLHWEVTVWELFATSRPLVEICPKRVSAKRCVGAAAGQTFQVWPLPKRRQARGGRKQQGPIAEHEPASATRRIKEPWSTMGKKPRRSWAVWRLTPSCPKERMPTMQASLTNGCSRLSGHEGRAPPDPAHRDSTALCAPFANICQGPASSPG